MSAADYDFSDDEYFDDVIEEDELVRPKIGLKIKLSVLAIASVIAYSTLGSTFASKIQLASGVVEYGQGVLVATACSPTISLTPYATFANATGNNAAYRLTSLQVSGISTGCYGKDLILRAYDSTTSTPLTLYQTGGSTNYDSVRVYDNNGSFSLAGSGLTYSEISNISTGFTVTLYNAVGPAVAKAGATSVYKFTVETVDHDGTLTQTSLPSGSLNFANTTTDISYASDPNLNLGASSFTIDVWAKITNAQNQTFFDSGGDVNSGGGFAFWIESSAIKLRINGVGHDLAYALTTGQWNDSNFHHYAAVRDVNTYSIYVDGTRVATTTYSGLTISNSNVVVGQLNQYRSTYALSGYLRNIRVVKGTALYSGTTLSVPPTPLTNVSGTMLLLLAQNPANPTYDSSNYHWTPLVSSSLPPYVAP